MSAYLFILRRKFCCQDFIFNCVKHHILIKEYASLISYSKRVKTFWDILFYHHVLVDV